MKKGLFLLLAFMVTLAVNAQQVSRQQALQKAQQFMPGKQFGEAKSFARGEKSTDMEPFYIFNAKGQKGFVIVSGDDRTEPILGYSDKGEITEKNMPENLKYWLECYEIQMKSLDQDKVAGSRGVTRSTSKTAVAPLIQSKWDQGEPYNYMCPSAEAQEVDGKISFTYADIGEEDYNPKNRCVTGCVATAMAQVMRYWKWPESCGAMDKYDICYEDDVVDHSFHGLEATTFDWDNMTLTYSSSEPEESPSAKAVSTLMRYCGQAVKMDYGLGAYGGSGANVYASNMVNTFGYSKNARSVYRMFYSVAEWEDMIYQELANSRPVLYGGSSATGGHQFICDGYDGNGLFHFNWGWSGDSDGFFVLSLANPQELGSGGGTNTDGYSYVQDAIIGLMKPAEGEVETPHIYSLIPDDETWVTTYTRSSAAEDFTSVSLPRLIFMQYDLEANPWPDYAIVYAWGLYQDGALVEVYGTASTTLTAGGGNWRQDVPTADLGAGWADGTYMLRQVYRPQGSKAWMPCEMKDGNGKYLAVSYIKATISGNTLTLSKANEDYLSSDITVNSVSCSPSPIEAGRAVEVTVNLTNNGDAFQELILLWVNNKMTTLVCGSVEPGKTGDVKLHFVPEYIGEIPLSISTDEDGKNVIWEGSLTVEAPKPQSLSGTVSIDGFNEDSRVLYGNTLRVKAQVINKGENTYDNQIKLYLYQKIQGTNQGSRFALSSVNATIQPGETKEVVFTVQNLNYEEEYFFYINYISEGKEYDSNYQPFRIQFDGAGWTFSLAPLSSVQGDANGNGVVDTNDVKTVADYIMGRDPLPFVFDNANLNGDSKVDAADLVLLIKMAL